MCWFEAVFAPRNCRYCDVISILLCNSCNPFLKAKSDQAAGANGVLCLRGLNIFIHSTLNLCLRASCLILICVVLPVLFRRCDQPDAPTSYAARRVCG